MADFVGKVTRSLFFSVGLLWFTMYPGVGRAADVPAITGHWLTFDDTTGKKRSIVAISQHNDKLTAVIIQVFFRPGEATRCLKCTGVKHNQALVGMEIFSGLRLYGRVWKGATILDPENGKEYDCALWFEGDKLTVRGYLFPFFRTQQWVRYDTPGN